MKSITPFLSFLLLATAPLAFSAEGLELLTQKEVLLHDQLEWAVFDRDAQKAYLTFFNNGPFDSYQSLLVVDFSKSKIKISVKPGQSVPPGSYDRKSWLRASETVQARLNRDQLILENTEGAVLFQKRLSGLYSKAFVERPVEIIHNNRRSLLVIVDKGLEFEDDDAAFSSSDFPFIVFVFDDGVL